MKVGLLGFDLSNPNKGCEALSYSFINLLRGITPDIKEIHVFGYASLGKFPEVYPDLCFHYHRLKMKDVFYWKKLYILFNECDCIFDITYGDGFSDIYGKLWNANTNIAKEIANKSKTPFVLLPQTYGPYSNVLLKRWAIRIVNKASLVFSRDEQSIIEMQELGCHNMYLATDLAFDLPYYKDKYISPNDKIKLGVNVSSLLWDKGHKIILKTDYREYCRRILEHYLNKAEYEVHLIAHVIDRQNDASIENDYRVCRDLQEEYPNSILMPAFDNPIDIKSYISSMDIFIGARMHSTIGAISAGVPVIPISYSKKFEGLYNNLDYPYVVSATALSTDEAFKLTSEYITNLETLEMRRSISMKETAIKLNDVKNRIKELLNNKQ